LLPGTLCTGAVFDGFLDALGVPSENRQYVELSRPCVDDYRPVFEAVTNETVVCGFSLGAIVAAHAADVMTPHRLILFGLNPFADDPGRAEARRMLANDVTTQGGGAALRSRKPDIFGAEPDQTHQQICKMAAKTAHLIDAQTQLALTRPGALAALAGAQMPVLSVTGTCDTSAPVAQGQAAADAAPLGSFYALDGLGHFALLENPQTCAAIVAQADQAIDGAG